MSTASSSVPSVRKSGEVAGVDALCSDADSPDACIAETWLQRYRRVRKRSRWITQPLAPEDCVVQSMPDASPTKWHLAHTTWFFETFLLSKDPKYLPFDTSYRYVFNSYYNGVGEQFPRHRRGLLSRPTLDQVWKYREHVDAHMVRWLTDGSQSADDFRVLETGLHHEQQHQELMLTDILHALSIHPAHPKYREAGSRAKIDGSAARCSEQVPEQKIPEHRWVELPESIVQIGHDGDGFAFDNETPRHRRLQCQSTIGSRLVTNGEYAEFIEAGGYERPQWWLSAGWATVQSGGWAHPLYWIRRNDDWYRFSLEGLVPLDRSAPVSNVSYFEADAYARFRDARLPTECEWETAIRNDLPDEHAQFEHQRDGETLQPQHTSVSEASISGAFGSLWQWTSSAYDAYPGYRPPPGAIGEYNGKFMCGQFVLRGSSLATSPGHSRISYRNFFPPDARWQFTGIRLAQDVGGDDGQSE